MIARVQGKPASSAYTNKCRSHAVPESWGAAHPPKEGLPCHGATPLACLQSAVTGQSRQKDAPDRDWDSATQRGAPKQREKDVSSPSPPSKVRLRLLQSEDGWFDPRQVKTQSWGPGDKKKQSWRRRPPSQVRGQRPGGHWDAQGEARRGARAGGGERRGSARAGAGAARGALRARGRGRAGPEGRERQGSEGSGARGGEAAAELPGRPQPNKALGRRGAHAETLRGLGGAAAQRHPGPALPRGRGTAGSAPAAAAPPGGGRAV